MIQKDILESVTRTMIGGEKTVVGAVEGTPLESILANVSANQLITQQSTEVPGPDAIVEYVNSVAEHSEQMADFARKGANAVRTVADTLRNTVNPHFRRVREAIMSVREEYTEGFGWNIQPVGLHPVMNNQLVTSISTKYRDGIGETESNIGKAVVPVSWNVASLNPIIDACAPEALKDKVDDIVSRRGDVIVDWLRGYTIVRKDALSSEPEVAAVGLLILESMDIPPAGLDMSLPVWQTNRLRLIYLLNTVVVRAFESYDLALRNDRLHVNDNGSAKASRCVKVNDQVYKKLLAEGVSPEAVIGNELADRPAGFKDLTDPAIADKLVSLYNREFDKQVTARREKVEGQRRKHFIDVFRKDIAVVAKEGFPIEGDTVEKAMARLDHVIDSIVNERFEHENIDDVIMAVLVGIWYVHTGVVKLIDCATRIEKQYPDLNPGEIFTLAKIRYVSDWISSQLVITGDVKSFESDLLSVESLAD